MDDFGKEVDAAKAIVIGHGAEDRIRDLAHAALEGHSLREPAVRFLEADKVQNAFADIPRNFVGFHERRHFVITVVFHDGDDLVHVDTDKLFTRAVACTIDGERLCVRRQFREGAVMHADAAVSKAGVQFQDNLRGHLEVGHGIAARCREADAAVGQDRADFDDSDRRRRDGTGAYEVAHLAEVGVDVVDTPVVDSLAEARIALVWHAEFKRTGAGKGAVTAIAGRSTRKERHLEELPFRMQLFCTGGKRCRDRLRVTRQGKTRNAENITILNHCGGIGR